MCKKTPLEFIQSMESNILVVLFELINVIYTYLDADL